jgi:rubrerythrin
LLRDIAGVEAYHEKRFSILLNLIEQGRLFERDQDVTWKCRLCGFIKTDTSPPSRCPICECGFAYFEVLVLQY